MSAAVRDRDQAMSALAIANEHRRQRSDLKRALGQIRYPESLRSAAFHLNAPSAALRTMPVEVLLCSCRGFGRGKAAQLLRRAGVLGTIELGRITTAERVAILREIRDVIARNGGGA